MKILAVFTFTYLMTSVAVMIGMSNENEGLRQSLNSRTIQAEKSIVYSGKCVNMINHYKRLWVQAMTVNAKYARPKAGK